MKKALKDIPEHTRFTKKTVDLIEKYRARDCRTKQSQIEYFVLLGIYQQKIHDGEIPRTKHFNAQDYS